MVARKAWNAVDFECFVHGINPPNIKEKIQWVQPKPVCEVEYAELTADDQLRQTIFLGWRDDKKAKEVALEQPRTGLPEGHL